MISDTLSDAVTEINYYLKEDGLFEYSKCPLYSEIISVRNAMESLREKLDRLPVEES